jgi:hypothetical protein
MVALPSTRTILQIVNDIQRELGIPTTDQAVGSSDLTTRQLLRYAFRTGRELQSRYQWSQLIKEHTITLVDSQANYALPEDMDYQHFRTYWDRTNEWELVGPLSPQEWQWLQSGSVTSFPRKRFRIQGFADKQFYIDPTPDSSEAGNTLVFEYQTRTWIRPTVWVTSTSFGADAYCFNDGNIYQNQGSAATTGATAPTHTSGSVSDGGVTWTYISAPYNQFLADTDIPLIDEELISMGAQWRWNRLKGFDHLEMRADYEAQAVRMASAINSADTLDMTNTQTPKLLSSLNIPDTGFG